MILLPSSPALPLLFQSLFIVEQKFFFSELLRSHMPAHPEHYQRCRLALSNRGWGRTRAWEARITGATSETRQHTATLSYPMLRDCQGFLTAWLCGTSSEIYWTPLTSPGSLNPNPEALGAVRFSACCQAHVILPLPVLFPPAQSILPKPRGLPLGGVQNREQGHLQSGERTKLGLRERPLRTSVGAGEKVAVRSALSQVLGVCI